MVWFALAAFVILPAVNAGGEWAYGRYLAGGTDGGDTTEFWQPQKVLTIVLLLVATAGLVLRSPISLVLLPTLAWRFLSSNEAYWGLDWHYSAVLMPVAFLAAVDGISRAKGSASVWESWWARLGPAMLAVGCAVILVTRPTPLLEMQKTGWTADAPRAAAVEEILAMIPAGSTVESDIALMNYVVGPHVVYWIGHENPTPEFVLIGPDGGAPQEWGDALGVATTRYPGSDYDLLASRDGYSLARLRAGE